MGCMGGQGEREREERASRGGNHGHNHHAKEVQEPHHPWCCVCGVLCPLVDGNGWCGVSSNASGVGVCVGGGGGGGGCVCSVCGVFFCLSLCLRPLWEVHPPRWNMSPSPHLCNTRIPMPMKTTVLSVWLPCLCATGCCHGVVLWCLCHTPPPL